MQQLQTTSGIDVGISQSFSPNANFDPEVPCAPGGSSHTMSKANPRSSHRRSLDRRCCCSITRLQLPFRRPIGDGLYPAVECAKSGWAPHCQPSDWHSRGAHHKALNAPMVSSGTVSYIGEYLQHLRVSPRFLIGHDDPNLHQELFCSALHLGFHGCTSPGHTRSRWPWRVFSSCNRLIAETPKARSGLVRVETQSRAPVSTCAIRMSLGLTSPSASSSASVILNAG